MDPTGSTANFRTGLRFALVQPGSHFQVQQAEAPRTVVAKESTASLQRDPSLPPNKLTRTYACAECGLSTTRSRMFLLHQLVSHASQHNFHLFLCPHCEYGSRWRQKLVRHSEILHGSHPTAAPLTPQRVRELYESFGRDLDRLLAWTYSSSCTNSAPNAASTANSSAGATGANPNSSNPTPSPSPARPARPSRPLGGAMPSQVPLPSLLLVPCASEQSQAYAAPLDLSIKRSPSASASASADSPQTQTPPSDAPANECPPPPALARSNKRKNKAPQRVAEPSAASPEPELSLSTGAPLAEQPQDADMDELPPLHIAEADEELLEGDSLDGADADADAEEFSLTLPHADSDVGFSASTLELPAGSSSARLRCGQCGYLAPHPSKLRSHLAAHANLRAYMCSICGVRSNWPSDIRSGLRLRVLLTTYE